MNRSMKIWENVLKKGYSKKTIVSENQFKCMLEKSNIYIDINILGDNELRKIETKTF